jgi:ankyrin repeat protein
MNKFLISIFFIIFPSFTYGMDLDTDRAQLYNYFLKINGDLLQKVDENKMPEVNDALEKGADIDIQSSMGTPLMKAALAGNSTMVRFLLSQGATINTPNARGQVALMYAAFNDHLEIVEFLIKNGADIHRRDMQGKTALLCAASKEVAKLLIDAGAPLDTADNQGWTLLMLATYNGYTALKKFLIDNGACLTAQNNKVDAAFSLARLEDSSFDISSILNATSDRTKKP